MARHSQEAGARTTPAGESPRLARVAHRLVRRHGVNLPRYDGSGQWCWHHLCSGPGAPDREAARSRGWNTSGVLTRSDLKEQRPCPSAIPSPASRSGRPLERHPPVARDPRLADLRRSSRSAWRSPSPPRSPPTPTTASATPGAPTPWCESAGLDAPDTENVLITARGRHPLDQQAAESAAAELRSRMSAVDGVEQVVRAAVEPRPVGAAHGDPARRRTTKTPQPLLDVTTSRPGATTRAWTSVRPATSRSTTPSTSGSPTTCPPPRSSASRSR